MMKPKRRETIAVARVGDWWICRHRERVAKDGTLQEVNRARKIAPVGPLCKTKAQARELAKITFKAMIAERRQIEPTRNITFRAFVEDIYLPYADTELRVSTARNYRNMWLRYIAGQDLADMWLRDIETRHIQQLLQQIARTHTITRTTIQHAKHLLSGAFRIAAQQGFLDRGRANPVQAASIPSSAPRGREGESYTLEEILGMLALVNGISAVAISVAAYTGLRQGELRGLRWEDYKPAPDADSLGTIEVNRSIWRSTVNEPKTERSKGSVPVIPPLAERLARHRKAQGNPASGLIFPNHANRPLSLDSLYWRTMREIFQKAGIRWRGWHGFRRGLASNLNRLGVDDSVIQKILRHSDVAVTRACYIKTTHPEAVAAMQRFSENVAQLESRSQLVLKNDGQEGETVIQ